MKITNSMVANFKERTTLHIETVRAFLNYVATGYALAGDEATALELRRRGEVHDASKWEEPERSAYIRITEYFRRGASGRAAVWPDDANEAVKHHYAHNSHHVEHHADRSVIPKADAIEMACDWAAMSWETKRESALNWALVAFDRKYVDLSEDTKKLIINTIDDIDRCMPVALFLHNNYDL